MPVCQHLLMSAKVDHRLARSTALLVCLQLMGSNCCRRGLLLKSSVPGTPRRLAASKPPACACCVGVHSPALATTCIVHCIACAAMLE